VHQREGVEDLLELIGKLGLSGAERLARRIAALAKGQEVFVDHLGEEIVTAVGIAHGRRLVRKGPASH